MQAFIEKNPKNFKYSLPRSRFGSLFAVLPDPEQKNKNGLAALILKGIVFSKEVLSVSFSAARNQFAAALISGLQLSNHSLQYYNTTL